VGNNFWTAYISYIVANGGYAEKATAGSGRIAISEGWGHYTEWLFTINKYLETGISARTDEALRPLEQQAPSDYANGWLINGMTMT
jgi:hypothetical protein